MRPIADPGAFPARPKATLRCCRLARGVDLRYTWRPTPGKPLVVLESRPDPRTSRVRTNQSLSACGWWDDHGMLTDPGQAREMAIPAGGRT